MQNLMGLRAEDFPLGTVIEIPAQRLQLRLEHGRKPWRRAAGGLRFSHAEVNGSIEAGEVKVITVGDSAVADV